MICRALLISLLLPACVVRTVERPADVGSFRVEILSMDPFTRPAGCADVPDQGSADCPRPFASVGAPVRVRFRATALDHSGNSHPWTGAAQVDVRPGRLASVGPGGSLLPFDVGESQEMEVLVVLAAGPARIWVEDCGSSASPGGFATGVSVPIYFERPRIDQLNATLDNSTGPLMPRADNVCAIAGDPRYGLGVDADGNVGFVGYSHGRRINAPPPPTGDRVEIVGCTRGELDQRSAVGEACAAGPLVVSGIDNTGFFVVDLHPASVARGFNSIFAATRTYPSDLELGDILTSLLGAPGELDGSTQMRDSSWHRDGVGRGSDILPPPTVLDPLLYSASLNARTLPPCEGCSFGGNNRGALAIEALEGAVVCVDNVAPASNVVRCDADGTRTIERQGCSVVGAMPPRCEIGVGSAPVPPACDDADQVSTCLPFTESEIEACALGSFAPADPVEYCCERVCYQQLDCIEESALTASGMWVGDLHGRYERTSGDSGPVKLAFVTRDVAPDFDPVAFGRAQRNEAPQQRETLRIIGNLRHVLGARPVWVVVPRQPSDIAVQQREGPCP